MFKFFKSSKTLDNLVRFDFMKIHRISFGISLFIILLSILSFFINKINFGIDFTGGMLFDISVEDNRNIGGFRDNLTKNGFNDFSIQNYGKNGFIVRVSEKDAKNQSEKQLSNNEYVQIIKNTMNSFFENKIEYNKIDFVGPQVGKELVIKGTLALFLSLLVIMVYIWARFEWEFGIGAVVTLFHDTIIIFGIYSIFKIEFDLTSIAAILTVIGYSINDSVVIYDRIREYLPKYKKSTLTEVINISLNTTLRRTLLTSSTTIVCLMILALIGGESVKSFSFIVFLGIIIGTYSSIYISAPILLYIGVNKKKLK